MNKTWTESDVICDAIGERSTREAAEWLNEKLPEDYRTSHMSVSNWANAAYEPNDDFIRALMMFYPEADARFMLGKQLVDMRYEKMKAIMQKYGKAAVIGGAK